MADGEAIGPRAAKTPRVFEVIRDRVRDDLARGVLTPGDKLPAERELAERLGFSRAAVREALRGLEATGIIQLQKGIAGGAFIQGGNTEMVSRSISDIIVLGKIPLRQVMEVRSLLLARAVELACERAKPEEFDAIEENIRETEASANGSQEQARCVADFYTLLGALSGNELLAILIVATTSIALNSIASHKVEFTSELIGLRKKVLGRLRARDALGAARAIGENIAFLHGFVIARAAAH